MSEEFQEITGAKRYWEIARRYHLNRRNPAIRPAAVFDMRKLQQQQRLPTCVLRRVNAFIAKHHRGVPGNSPPSGGPSVA